MSPALLLRLLLLSGCSASASAAVVMSVDFNDALDSATDTAPGFTRYLLSDDALTLSPYSLDVNPAGSASIDDVHRLTPATAGALSLGALYRDSIFAGGDNTANYYRIGLDTTFSGLTPGKQYSFTVWSYDSGATGARVSDWSVLGLGGPRFGINNYSFDGALAPSADTANRFNLSGIADAAGTLILRARQSAASTLPQVFLNALTLDQLAPAPLQATPVLSLDFNARAATGAANTQATFSEFLLSGTAGTAQTATTRTFGTLSVAITAVGATIDDRARATPVNAAPFSDSLLLRDFIFSAAGGLSATVSGLVPGQSYLVELWSYDSTSGASSRTSDWTVNGTFLWDDYAFNGSNLPLTNNDYKMAGSFNANASGQLIISATAVLNAPSVFLNALRISLLEPVPIVNFGHPIISEFLADNTHGITDEDGATSDWIEIWNTTDATLNLAGWRLSDDPLLSAKWIFPTGVTLASQERLRLWASGRNRTSNPAALHTNFSLTKLAGASLLLAKPDATVVSAFGNLPAQVADVSYGLSGTVEPLTAGFYQTPTPLGPNGTQVPGFVADTTFDIKRGYFSTPQTVHVTCATPAALLFYTTDGSEPTTASAPVPSGGITIGATTVLRAKAFLPPLAPSNTDTQTYLFLAQVQNQPAAPAGWPATWGTDSEVATNNAGIGTVPADYEMDSRVVNAAIAGHTVADGLAALPSLSLALSPADFLGAGNGIYSNPKLIGIGAERATSLEWLYTDGTSFHLNAGMRIHGNSSRRPYRMQKHSFRFAFRGEYGAGKLDEKLFEDSKVKSFDKLVLHAFFTDGWGMVSWDPPRYRPDDSVYFRDPFLKKCWGAMGWPTVHGRYVNVYINGLYWGVYEVAERVDDTFLADELGGLPTDYDLMGDFTITQAGSSATWDSLFALINNVATDMTSQATYQTLLAQLDVANFCDYYLLHVHADAEDWPHHNGYAYRNHAAGADGRWRFLVWDQEITFDPTLSVDRLSTGAANTTTDRTAGVLFSKLKLNAEFRLLFADRVHKHLDNSGALSLPAEQARWQGLADLLDRAIVPESARWGDTAEATPYGNAVPAGKIFTREASWLPSVSAVRDAHFANLHSNGALSTVAKLRAQSPKLYPLTDAPVLGQFGGNVVQNYALSMSAAAGTIFYTLDGSDPRTAYSGVARGTAYSGAPVKLSQTCTLKARVLNAGEWSALTEATFIVGVAASAANLAISEINYHPAFSEEEEFIELVNSSSQTIDLTGVHFEGLTYTFADGTLLASGERIVLVRNSVVFAARYGSGIRTAGPYSGALDNTGEQIAVLAANGSDIERFTYNDQAPWPTAPDGEGRSLVLRVPGSDPGNPANWRASLNAGGSPGLNESLPLVGTPTAPALLAHALLNPQSEPPSGRIELLGIPGTAYLTLSARVNPSADDLTLGAEFSSDLLDWKNQAAVYLGESLNLDNSVTRKWRAPQPFGATPQYLRLRATLVGP